MRGVPRGRAALMAAVVALFTNIGFAAPPLTLEEALRIFRASGFDLLVADAAVEAARADLTIAGAVPNPTLSASAGRSSTYDPSLCAGCSNHSVSVGVSDQAISDLVSGRRHFRQAVARAALEVSVRSRADVERNLELMLKQQLLQAELAKKSFEFARQAQELAASAFELTQKRYHAGAISEADVARADVQRLEAGQALDAAAQALNVSKSQVAFLLGMKEARPESLDVGNDLTSSTSQLSGIDRQAIYSQALASRPDLAAARSQIERARSSVSLARRLRIPDFSPSLQYSREGRGQSAIQPPTVTFGVTAPLPLFYRYHGELAKARSDLRTQEILRDKIEAQVNADVNASFAAFEGSRSRLDRMQSLLLPQAGRARDLVRLQYEKGATSLFEFLDAQRTYLATQNEYLQNLNDYWSALFQMEQAAGMELRR
jgi:cobalt-zinc-cadmium efflux system outer membrane protein